MKSVPSLSRHHGFSITEVMIVIMILGILAALLAPMFRGQSEASKGLQCMTRLREISLYLNAYAADHQMKISFMRDGKTSRMWYSELQKHARLSDQVAQVAFGCPSLPSKEVTSWVCYGFRAGSFKPVKDDPGAVVRPDGTGGTGYYEFSYATVSEPGKFFIMADTGTASGKQTFRIVPPGLYSGSGIQTRHQERANVLFLDGHVEALDLKGLQDLRFETVLNSKGESTSILP